MGPSRLGVGGKALRRSFTVLVHTLYVRRESGPWSLGWVGCRRSVFVLASYKLPVTTCLELKRASKQASKQAPLVGSGVEPWSLGALDSKVLKPEARSPESGEARLELWSRPPAQARSSPPCLQPSRQAGKQAGRQAGRYTPASARTMAMVS